MKKVIILITLAIIIVVALLVVLSYSTPASKLKSKCDALEMRHGYACCKDFNRNAICDKDEVFIEKHPIRKKRAHFISESNPYAALKALQTKAAANNLLTWEARKKLEDEQREIEKKQKNWVRKRGNKYIFGYDDRYDPRAY